MLLSLLMLIFGILALVQGEFSITKSRKVKGAVGRGLGGMLLLGVGMPFFIEYGDVLQWGVLIGVIIIGVIMAEDISSSQPLPSQPFPPQPLASQSSPLAMTGKTFGIRAIAFIVDSLVLVAVDTIVQFVVFMVISAAWNAMRREFQVAEPTSATQLLNFIVFLVSPTLYFACFEGLYGATVGKQLLGMRVIKEDGTPADLRAASLRALLRLIEGLLLGLPAYFSMKAPLYQRYGDRIARTIVVDAQNVLPQPPRAGGWFLAAAGIYLVGDVLITLVWMSVTIR